MIQIFHKQTLLYMLVHFLLPYTKELVRFSELSDIIPFTVLAKA